MTLIGTFFERLDRDLHLVLEPAEDSECGDLIREDTNLLKKIVINIARFFVGCPSQDKGHLTTNLVDLGLVMQVPLGTLPAIISMVIAI